MRASVAVLKEIPDFNSSLNPAKDGLIEKKYWNIGFAVRHAGRSGGAGDQGRRQEGRSADLEPSLANSRPRRATANCRRRKCPARLSPFPRSAALGAPDFTPIVNAPEVAILGVVRSKMAPVWNGKEFLPRLMLPLSLSYDHRVIDGAAAARFARALAVVLEDIRRLAL